MEIPTRDRSENKQELEFFPLKEPERVLAAAALSCYGTRVSITVRNFLNSFPRHVSEIYPFERVLVSLRERFIGVFQKFLC